MDMKLPIEEKPVVDVKPAVSPVKTVMKYTAAAATAISIGLSGAIGYEAADIDYKPDAPVTVWPDSMKQDGKVKRQEPKHVLSLKVGDKVRIITMVADSGTDKELVAFEDIYEVTEPPVAPNNRINGKVKFTVKEDRDSTDNHLTQKQLDSIAEIKK